LKSRSITRAYKLVYVKDSAPRKPACPRGREEKIYMYKSIILEKGAESLAHSMGLEGSFLDEPRFPAKKRGEVLPLLKMQSFHCFQINQDPSMKSSIKKGVLHDC
jgi:hypothetical protein